MNHLQWNAHKQSHHYIWQQMDVTGKRQNSIIPVNKSVIKSFYSQLLLIQSGLGNVTVWMSIYFPIIIKYWLFASILLSFWDYIPWRLNHKISKKSISLIIYIHRTMKVLCIVYNMHIHFFYNKHSICMVYIKPPKYM